MNQNNKACTLNSCMNQNEIYFWRERECVFCGVSPFYSTIKLEKKKPLNFLSIKIWIILRKYKNLI